MKPDCPKCHRNEDVASGELSFTCSRCDTSFIPEDSDCTPEFYVTVRVRVVADDAEAAKKQVQAVLNESQFLEVSIQPAVRAPSSR